MNTDTMSDRLQLSPRHRHVLEALVREYLPDTEVWAYGSRGDDRGHEGSDLDLVLRGPGLNEISCERLTDFGEAIRESTIPFRVEVRDWARLSERFRREVEGEYEVVAGGACGAPASEPLSLSMSGSAASTGEWRESTWGDEITLQYGKARRGRSHGLGSFRVFGSNGPIGWTDTALAPGPGVVLGRKGAYRGVAYSPDPFFVIDTAYYVVPRSTHNVRWLYYAIKHYKLGEIDDGSPIPSTTRAAVYPRKLVVPSLPEQDAIAHILGTLDDKIELNRRMNETLEAMAHSLFKSWFVDFDPVRAKMEGRDTRLPEDIADLFPDRMVNSELGEIPEGWEATALPERIDVNPRRPLRRGTLAPYLPMANMPTRGHMPESVAVRPFGSGMRFANGDTLVARITPCLENGKTAYVDFLTDAEIGWGSTEYIVLRPQPPLPNHFAYCLARSARFREFAIQNMSGTSGRQRVPATALRGLLTVFPSDRIATRFGEVVGSLFDRASCAGRESRTFAALRDTLLPKLISGEIRLEQPESITGEVP